MIDVDLQEPQAIVVAPTRELAQQLFQAASHLCKFKQEVNVKLFIGGTDIEKTNNAVIDNLNSIIGTPHVLMTCSRRTSSCTPCQQFNC